MNSTQLNIRIPPELLKRIQAAAVEQDRPVATVVRAWIEAGLAGDSDVKPDRYHLLEARIAALEAATGRTPRPAAPPPVAAPLAPAAGDLTTTDAMALAGGTRQGWDKWPSRHQPGEVREVGGHRFELLGKVKPNRGGPDRWMWRVSTAATSRP